DTPTDLSWQRIKDAGVLKIATALPYPPLEFKEKGKLVGLDIDLGYALAKQLGVDAKFEEIDWNWQEITKRLSAHEFDVVISGVTIEDDREEQVAFVEYLSMPLAFVCRKGITVHTEKELAGKVVAVQKDTPGLKRVQRLEREGYDIKIITFPTTIEVFEALRDGKAHATIAHAVVAHRAKQEFQLEVFDNVRNVLKPERVGIALRKEDKALKDALDRALKAIMQDRPEGQDSVFGSLLESWFPRESPDR